MAFNRTSGLTQDKSQSTPRSGSPDLFRCALRISAVLVCSLASALPANAAAPSESQWPAWEVFSDHFIQEDGRVVDVTFDAKSTSEGQSYGLFFALVANQREDFDTILEWTSNNLAEGNLGEELPAWHWGEMSDGSWGVKDPNSASDSDLWIAYTLLEAARLWSEPDYAETAHELLDQISRLEIAQAGSTGPVLLPGEYGFKLDNRRYRINPSYLPGFMFRYLEDADAEGPWGEIWQTYMDLSPQIFAEGVAPDLFIVDAHGNVSADTESTPSGSYDAIRVYLWAGMSSGPDRQKLLELLEPFAELIRENGETPEKVNPVNGKALDSHYSPTGYAGAVLPFLDALEESALLRQEGTRARSALSQARRGAETNYYDLALILFGEGWRSGKYRFNESGQLEPDWNS